MQLNSYQAGAAQINLRINKDVILVVFRALHFSNAVNSQMAYLLRTENKNAANADGSMSIEQQRDYLRKYEAELVSPKEMALRARGASNAGYHYLGCAKTFALMGEAFAKAILEMRDQQNNTNGKESPTP